MGHTRPGLTLIVAIAVGTAVGLAAGAFHWGVLAAGVVWKGLFLRSARG